MTTFASGLTVTTYRVSVFDQFVVVVDCLGKRRWMLTDESGYSVEVLATGDGEPPIGLFPLGLAPAPMTTGEVLA